MSSLCSNGVPYEVIVEVDCNNIPTGDVYYVNLETKAVTTTPPVDPLGPCDGLAGIPNTVFTCENVQDCIATMLDDLGFAYSDSTNAFVAYGTAGQVLTSNGHGGSFWSSFVPGTANITSIDGSLTITGPSSAPVLSVNWSNSNNIEGVQDAVATMLNAVGMTYNDAAGLFVSTGASGTVLTSDGAGGATWAPPPGSSFVTSGRLCDGTVSGQTRLAGDSLNVVFATGQGSTSVTKSGSVVTTTLNVNRPKLRTVFGIAGPINTATTDVFVVTAGGADVVIGPFTACDPTDIWIKNVSNDVIYITGLSGTIDGESYIMLDAAGTGVQPVVHLVWTGSNLIVL